MSYTSYYKADKESSYIDERTAGTNITYIDDEVTKDFLKELGFTGLTGHWITDNNVVTYDGKDYQLYDCANVYRSKTGKNSDFAVYNMYDLIALAKTTKHSDEDIVKAINAVNDKYYGKQYHGYRETYCTFTPTVLKPDGSTSELTDWTPADVQRYNQNTLPAMQQLVDRINEQYPDLNATVITKLDAGGESYTYTLEYTNPSDPNGERLSAKLTADDLSTGADGKASDADINTWIKNSTPGVYINQYKDQTANQKTNADAQERLGNTVAGILNDPWSVNYNPNLGTGAVTNQTVSQADQDKVTAQTPGTDNLHIWNRDKDKNITGAVLNAIPGVNTNTPDQNKQREAFTRLQELINTSTEESVGSTLRDVDTQRKQLLDQIRNDPATYQAIVQQLRADSAAGTIAGQRAANANTALSEQDANYNAAADELYSSLFGKDNNIVDATRQDVFDTKANGLDAYITEQLNAASQDAKKRVQAANDFGTLVDIMRSGLDVEESKHQNAADLAGAASDAETAYLVESIRGLASADRAKQDAALKLLTDNLDLGEKYLNAVTDGSADVTDALGKIITDIENGEINVDNWHSSPGLVEMLGGEAISEKVKPVVYDNTQYNAAVNDTKFSEYIDNLPELTKTYTPEEILQLYGLGDYLTKTGLEAQYGNFSADANKQADQVFNAAQRAYIASITAGDVKTAEQLTRLAQTNTGAKQNLNAAAALAKQYTQQFDSAKTGLRLSSDYLNQQSKNKNFVTSNQIGANTKYNTYWGNGNDTYDKSTVNAVTNAFNDAGILFKANAGSYGNKLMSTTQGLNTTNNNLSKDNIGRLSAIANATSGENFNNLVNNITNEGVKQSVLTRAEAMGLQGQQTKNKLNNK